MTDLLEHFVTQECIPPVCRLLREAIADPSTPRCHFEFNRFNITIDREKDIVVIEDALDATEAGSQRMSLTKFAAALRISAT